MTPITGMHDGFPSNSRREIAKSVPARISSAPTAPNEGRLRIEPCRPIAVVATAGIGATSPLAHVSATG